jgi:hypothetical protein
LSSKPFSVNAENQFSAKGNPPVPAERGLSQTAARRQTEPSGNHRRFCHQEELCLDRIE